MLKETQYLLHVRDFKKKESEKMRRKSERGSQSAVRL
jgi:hypothetical protein